MDTTKEFILMCEKAREIQDSHRKDELDIFFHDGCVKTIASKLPGCRGVNHIIERVEFRYVSDIRPKEWNDYCIWLPTQAQLQKMIDWPGSILIGHIPNNMLMLSYAYKDTRIKVKGTSMEQLWLAFVMLEKYQKFWNGKDWIKNEKKN